MWTGAFVPNDGIPLQVENQLEWAGDVPLAIYHRACKLIARADVLKSTFVSLSKRIFFFSFCISFVSLNEF